MDQQLLALNEQQKQLNDHNTQSQRRAQKFGAPYTPMNIEQFRNYKIKKAAQTGKIAYLEDVLLDDIKDKEERRKMIEERKQKFFPEIKVLQGSNFDKKADVDFTQQDTVVRENAFHLYGVDYMSNQKIRHYFSGNNHFRIQWLNDSACNLIFTSPEQAIQGIQPHVTGTSEQNQKGQIWYQLKDYEVDGVQRQLVCRLATNKDVKNNDRTGRDSQYYKWVMNKKRFHTYVKVTAYKELRKTKGIHHYKKQDRQAKIQARRLKKQQQSGSSSSGVDESSSSQSQIMGPQ